MIDSPIAARAAFEELQALLRVDVDPGSDDQLLIQLADIDVALQSVEAIAELTGTDEARWKGIVLKSVEIGRDIAQLGIDVLAWYAIPADPCGSNEEPVGGEPARRLRSRYLEQLGVDESVMMQLRDQLATWLTTLGPGVK